MKPSLSDEDQDDLLLSSPTDSRNDPDGEHSNGRTGLRLSKTLAPVSDSGGPLGGPVHVDFSQVDDVESFVTVPEGRYACRIAEVREGETQAGDLRWALRLEVADGELAGRTAAWDGLVWSQRGLGRVKYVLGVLGFDVSGALDVAASDLLDRRAVVEFFVEEYTDPNSGRRVERLAVPFLGYEPSHQADSPF